jgi:small conductance mechanosensitive channel
MNNIFELAANFDPTQLQSYAWTLGLRLLGAIAIWVIGSWVAKFLTTFLRRVMVKRHIDPTLINFAMNFGYAIAIAFVVIAVLHQLGIQTTFLITLIGASGLAIGLALQGSLANLAAGLLMVTFRPFRVDDYIEGAGGVSGVVEEIQILTTTLRSLDNKQITVPNAKLLNDNIINYSAKGARRIDLVFGVSYGEEIDRVKQVIHEVLAANPDILAEPAPEVGLLELAASSVNFAVRPWVKPSNYWRVYFAVNEAIKKQFDAEGISIPFP